MIISKDKKKCFYAKYIPVDFIFGTLYNQNVSESRKYNKF